MPTKSSRLNVQDRAMKKKKKEKREKRMKEKGLKKRKWEGKNLADEIGDAKPYWAWWSL